MRDKPRDKQECLPLKTVSSRVNDKEFEAISEHANQCGETVSNVLKKAVFERAAKSKNGCPDGYRLNRRVHQGMEKEESLSKDVGIIRSVLGWDKSLEQTKSADVKQPNEQSKVTLESYANYLRNKEKKKLSAEQIQDAVNEGTKELREDIEELKSKYGL